MQPEGVSKPHHNMDRFDTLMNETFGDSIELLSSYGPVQMCVYGFEYKYLPLDYRIKAECERGIIIITVINREGKNFSPWMIYPEARHYYYEDRDEDLRQLVELTHKAIVDGEIIFPSEKERLQIASTFRF